MPPPAEPGAPPAMVILVRHAEKAKDGGDDPALSSAGAERAKALAAALADSGVTAIVTTQLRRTGDTAAPLAAARQLTPEVVRIEKGEAIPAYAAAVAAAVRRHPGGVVLVVGHSNTVPAVIAALGGPKLPDLADAEYSNLFVLVPGAAGAQLTRTHYGEPDAKAAAAAMRSGEPAAAAPAWHELENARLGFRITVPVVPPQLERALRVSEDSSSPTGRDPPAVAASTHGTLSSRRPSSARAGEGRSLRTLLRSFSTWSLSQSNVWYFLTSPPPASSRLNSTPCVLTQPAL